MDRSPSAGTLTGLPATERLRTPTSSRLNAVKHRSYVLGAGALFIALPTGECLAQAGTSDTARAYRPARNHVAIEAGPVYAFGLSYARRIQDSRFMGGLGFGYAFEWNEHSFTRNVWDAGHFELFGRYVLQDFVHADAGFSYLQFAPEDDTSDSGNFIGLFASLSAGYRFAFVGGALRAGRVGGDVPSETGTILSVHARVVIPWGR